MNCTLYLKKEECDQEQCCWNYQELDCEICNANGIFIILYIFGLLLILSCCFRLYKQTKQRIIYIKPVYVERLIQQPEEAKVNTIEEAKVNTSIEGDFNLPIATPVNN